MELERQQLTVVLNALYESDVDRITVSHPSDVIGDLLSIELGDPAASTVRIEADADEYHGARRQVGSEHPRAVDELPDSRSYASALLAGGLVEPDNAAEIDEFLERNGNPDLTAGHEPVVAGFDTNLLPWRIADVLGLEPGSDATVNGYALATGVRDELDWDQKCSDTGPLESAFGDEFSELFNQPSGARREGRLGANYYRRLRDHRYADEIPTDRGDESIVAGYDEYQDENHKTVLLFSNDRDFVERARSHRVRAQRVEFPSELPREVTASWAAIQDTLYVLAVLFGVLVLPKVTLYGVWVGKGGLPWQREALSVECRSPTIEPTIERDLEILGVGD